MFDQITLDRNGTAAKPWSFAASITAQTALVGAALVLPLLHVAKLEPLPPPVFYPRSLGAVKLVPVPVHVASAYFAASSSTARSYRAFTAPGNIPRNVATGPDLPDAPMYAIGNNSGPAGGDPNGIPGLPEFTQQHTVPLPPPPAPHPVVQQTAHASVPMHVSEGVQAARLLFGPKPDYPPLAKQARISGTVRLQAFVATDGRIRSLQVLSGHPMLVRAALDSVARWTYQPTLLNGEPVEVLTEIQVNFVLNQ